MECEDYRELISARIDGADDPGVTSLVDAHLRDCGACRRWFDNAALITRMARIVPAEVGPDVAATVLERVPSTRTSLVTRLVGVGPGFSGPVSTLVGVGPGFSGPVSILRWVLGLLGIAQCCLGVLALLAAGDGSHQHGGSLGAGLAHISHESAAWNVALGVAFGWAALRVTHVAGLVPVLAAFVTVLFGVSVTDLFAGRVDPSRVSSHLLALVGLVVVVLLARLSPSGRAPLRTASGHDTTLARSGDEPRQPRLPIHRARFGHRGKARLTGKRAA